MAGSGSTSQDRVASPTSGHGVNDGAAGPKAAERARRTRGTILSPWAGFARGRSAEGAAGAGPAAPPRLGAIYFFFAAGFLAAGFVAAGFFAAGFAAGFFAAGFGAAFAGAAAATVVSTTVAPAASFCTDAMPLIAAALFSYAWLEATS